MSKKEHSKKVEAIDLTHILDEYENKWVILSEDYKRVVASGDSLEEIVAHISEGIVFNVGSFEGTYSPSTHN